MSEVDLEANGTSREWRGNLTIRFPRGGQRIRKAGHKFDRLEDAIHQTVHDWLAQEGLEVEEDAVELQSEFVYLWLVSNTAT